MNHTPARINSASRGPRASVQGGAKLSGASSERLLIAVLLLGACNSGTRQSLGAAGKNAVAMMPSTSGSIGPACVSAVAGRAAPTSACANATAEAGAAARSGVVRAGAGSLATASGTGGASAMAGAVAGTGKAGASAGGAGGAGSLAAADGGVASYYMGADVTDQESAPAEVRERLLDSMIEHGFNAIRLRTFVDPRAADGYDQVNGYADLAHTIEFGRQIKARGLFLAVDFHYSDNWADPGKQCVPIAWQRYTNISDLATALGEYTHDAITQLVAANARPDLVQVGNEITPGMLLHRCDQDGLPTGDHSVRGSIERWQDLGALLKAGVDAVRAVDPSILISQHIDRGGDKTTDTPGAALSVSADWLSQASKYVRIDAFGESCYQR